MHVCRWSDKTEVNFQNWAEGGAARTRKTRLCVAMSSSSGKHQQRTFIPTYMLRRVEVQRAGLVAGKWSTNKCSDLHGYVCKRKTVSVLETPREPHYIGGCPEKWLYFGHKVDTHSISVSCPFPSAVKTTCLCSYFLLLC